MLVVETIAKIPRAFSFRRSQSKTSDKGGAGVGPDFSGIGSLAFSGGIFLDPRTHMEAAFPIDALSRKPMLCSL